MSTPVYDLLVIGGGINGAGIARDAAGRGLSVLLVEQDDPHPPRR
jgi:glycerol-3-phosphate dehydrogenase